MAAIERFFIVSTVRVDNSTDWLFEDPAISNEGQRLAQFCGALDEGGYSVDRFVSIYLGTPKGKWAEEQTKVYDNAAEAKRDAGQRVAKARKSYKRGRSKGKKSSLLLSLENFRRYT